MATLDATASCSSSASNLLHSSSKIPQLSPSVTRLWRPAAQRNLLNQWSKLASYRQQWASSSSKGRSHATDLVNAYLSQRQLQTFPFNLWFFEFLVRFVTEKTREKIREREMEFSKRLIFSVFFYFFFNCHK